MTTVDALVQTLKKEETGIQEKKKDNKTVEQLIETPNIRKKFENILADSTNLFIGNLLSLVKSDTNFSKCDPMTIVSSAMQAATLKLPMTKDLGYVYIIPRGQRATMQLGYKGYIQLAQRTGQYKIINATPIYEGELISYNRLTEELNVDLTKRKNDAKVVGYAAYFALLNGFTKTAFATVEEMEERANKFSDQYKTLMRGKKEGWNLANNVWHNHFDEMCCKTLLKSILSKYGILSVDMQQAIAQENEIFNEEYEVVEEIE